MHELKIVAEPNNKLATDLASRLGQDYISIEIQRFADTESIIKIDQKHNFTGATVLFVHQFSSLTSASPFYSVNDELIKFLLCVHALKSCSVKKIIGFLPYLAYSRQESIGINSVLSLIGTLCKTAGVDALITSDVHSVAVHHELGLPFYSCDMAPFWTETIKEQILPHIKTLLCIAAPDDGGHQRARAVADALGCEFVSMKKERISADHAHVLTLKGDVSGKTVVIIDDILDTGRTALSACDLLIKSGASEVIGCFTHPVLSPGAVKRLVQSCFSKIFVTETLMIQSDDLPNKISVVSANGFFVKTLPGYISRVSN